MWIDEIVQEIHRVREAYAKSFNYDLDAIFADLRQKQEESGREVVTLSRPPGVTTRWSRRVSEISDNAIHAISEEISERASSQHKNRLLERAQYTLTELEEDDWGSANFHSSLVEDVHRLRHIPLKDLTAGDIRLMIGQSVSLYYLIPIALDILTKNPFIDCTYYPGDLLSVVIRIQPGFWETYPAMSSRAAEIARIALATIDTEESPLEMKAELQHFIEERVPL